MGLAVNRRSLLKQGLAAAGGLATALALPARALAQTSLTPASSGQTSFAQASDLSAYERRVLDIASVEMGRFEALLWRRDVVAVADFARPSALPRLHIVNLEAGTVRSLLVAHGRGSDPEHCGWLKSFSNTIGSEATSRGAYLTCEDYQGKYGTSLRLRGLDIDNSNAHDRAIVMHPAWYAAPDMLTKWGKLGRSEGCFATDPNQFTEVLTTLSGGHLLFADRIDEI